MIKQPDTKYQKDFLFFQEEFRKWQKKFELGNWNCRFILHKDRTNSASIVTNLHSYVADVYLSTTAPSHKVAACALHEAIHLLLSPLSDLGRQRYVTYEELYRAEESLVQKIMMVVEGEYETSNDTSEK